MNNTKNPAKDALAELTTYLNSLFNMRVRFDYQANEKVSCELYVSVKQLTRYYNQQKNSVFFNIEGTLAISLLDNKCAFYVGTLTDSIMNKMYSSQLHLQDNETTNGGLSMMEFSFMSKVYYLSNDPTSNIEVKNVNSEAIENF